MSQPPITLIGDGIENPWNAQTMIHAAGMFGGDCRFLDRAGLAAAWAESPGFGEDLGQIEAIDLGSHYTPVVPLDNMDGAASIHGFRMPKGAQPALVAGNERLGISPEVRARADAAVQIPMVSRRLNCLNVAAASAVALYSLTRGREQKPITRARPEQHRPELLLLGAGQHVELGSSIRSAGAFGWTRVLVEDRHHVWFGCDRATLSEGRAAARRQRNPIHLVPTTPDRRCQFEEVCVITTRRVGDPLHRANLARGPRQLIAIPDESAVQLEAENWDRLGATVRFVHLDLPIVDFQYHYRLIASIALAEAARQIGAAARPTPGRPRRRPVYDRSLAVLAEANGEVVWLEELGSY
jgi:hypothetical protein